MGSIKTSSNSPLYFFKYKGVNKTNQRYDVLQVYQINARFGDIIGIEPKPSNTAVFAPNSISEFVDGNGNGVYDVVSTGENLGARMWTDYIFKQMEINTLKIKLPPYFKVHPDTQRKLDGHQPEIEEIPPKSIPPILDGEIVRT